MMTVHSKFNGCTFYVPDNERYQDCLLEVFNGPEGPYERVLAAFSMARLVGTKIVKHDIYTSLQLRALNLSLSSSRERDNKLLGRVLLVRKTVPIPLAFVASHEVRVDIFHNEQEITSDDAQEILRDLSLQVGQELPGFLELMMANSASVYYQSRDYLAPRKLILESAVLRFGIGYDEETGEPVPLWTGSGISPKTAHIMYGDEEIKDLRRFAEMVLPPSVYEREFGEEKA
jgi:hypothetical protein